MQMHRRAELVGEVAKQRRSRPQGPARVRDDDRTPRSRPCGLAYGEGDMGRCSSRPR